MSEKKKKHASSARISGLVEPIQIHHEIPILERIKYPIIWERMTSGYRIQDLQLSKIESAIDIIRDYYINDEPICKGINLSDTPEGVEEYMKLITVWLKDTQSFAAIEEGSGMFVGVLIGRVLDKTVRTQSRLVSSDSKLIINKLTEPVVEVCKPSPCQEQFLFEEQASKKKKDRKLNTKKKTSSKSSKGQSKKPKSAPSESGDKSKSKSKSKASKLATKKLAEDKKIKETSIVDSSQPLEKLPMFDDEQTLFESPVLMKMHRFRSHVSKSCDILSLFNVPTYFSIHLMLVIPDHRGRGIGKALLRCAMDMSKKFKCDVISGTFTSKIAQNIAYKENFEVLQELKLCDWYENDEPVFSEITDLTETAATMAIKMKDPPPPEIPVPLTPPKRKPKVAHVS